MIANSFNLRRQRQAGLFGSKVLSQTKSISVCQCMQIMLTLVRAEAGGWAV